jgi:uncharacterized phage-associated protein
MEIGRSIQIVQHLLSKSSYRLNYTKLIKLLYLADREAFRKWDSSITGDQYASLPQGPVVSGMYNLIRGEHLDRFAQTQWNAFFMKDGYDLVAMHKDQLPVDELSPREVELLDSIEKQYRAWDFGQLIDLVHDRSKYPEWQDPGESSLPLQQADILKALGRTEEEVRQILEDDATHQKEEEYLRRCCV